MREWEEKRSEGGREGRGGKRERGKEMIERGREGGREEGEGAREDGEMRVGKGGGKREGES